MTRTKVTFSISIPSGMAIQIEELRKKEHRTRSELIREALRQYVARQGIISGRSDTLS